MKLLVLLTTLKLAIANRVVQVETPKYALNVSLHCSIKQNWRIGFYFTNALDSLRTKRESHNISDSNWFNKSYILEREPTQVDIFHTCNEEGKGPWRNVRRNLNENYTEMKNLGTWMATYIDQYLRSAPLQFSLRCDIKLDWFVEIYYTHSEDVENSRSETIEVKNSHQIDFTRDFNKNPTHIGFIHNCNSDPEIPLRKVPKSEYTKNTTLTNNGLKIFDIAKIVPPVPFTLSLYCGLKLNWNVYILYYTNEESVSNENSETVEVEGHNNIEFTKSFEKQPTQVQFIHDCTSNSKKDTLVVKKSALKEFYDLTDKGV